MIYIVALLINDLSYLFREMVVYCATHLEERINQRKCPSKTRTSHILVISNPGRILFEKEILMTKYFLVNTQGIL